ncbi:MAG TPA: O-antigen ligase family protein, partial [Candidatus Saccharimonadales bacterium]|nr:O-antigen ligase family protein [Candidatus Saccharimonadales bacterium]
CGFQTQDGFRFLGRYLRFLFIAPVYLAFRRYPPTAKTVFIGLAVGAFAGGVGSVWHFLRIHPDVRMEAATDLSIIFGDLSTTMVLYTIAGFGLMAASRRSWAMPSLLLSVAGGVAATLLSGTRGAWIPLLLLPLVLMSPIGRFLKRRYLFAVVVVLVAVFSSIYSIERSGVQERISDVWINIQGYSLALDAAKFPNDGNSVYPHCDDTATFLRAWLNAAYIPQNLEASVIRTDAEGPKNISGCGGGYAVLLQNIRGAGLATAAFDRVPTNREAKQFSSLLIRGMGVVTFAGAREPGVSFDFPDFHRVLFSTRNTSGKAVNVGVAAHQYVEFVPLDGYFGEYSMSIANNSVGQRLELWRAAWRLFLRHPLLGIGTGAYEPGTESLIASDEIAPFAGEYDHPHNDYLNALASFGIVGFLLLLIVLVLPIWLFLRAAQSGDHTVQALGLAGLFTVIGFAIYALTDVVFLHNMMVIWYVVYIALFYALLDAHASKLAKPEPPKQ